MDVWGDKKYPLLFDTEIIKAGKKLAGFKPPSYEIGLSVIMDDRCGEEDIEIKDDNRLVISNVFLLFDECHPLIDKENKRVVGFFSRKLNQAVHYGADFKNCRLTIGRYLMFAPYWREIHEGMDNKKLYSSLLLVQN